MVGSCMVGNGGVRNGPFGRYGMVGIGAVV
jgi:hypothetical protein